MHRQSVAVPRKLGEQASRCPPTDLLFLPRSPDLSCKNPGSLEVFAWSFAAVPINSSGPNCCRAAMGTVDSPAGRSRTRSQAKRTARTARRGARICLCVHTTIRQALACRCDSAVAFDHLWGRSGSSDKDQRPRMDTAASEVQETDIIAAASQLEKVVF